MNLWNLSLFPSHSLGAPLDCSGSSHSTEFLELIFLSLGFLFSLTFCPVITHFSPLSLQRSNLLNFINDLGVLWRCKLKFRNTAEMPVSLHFSQLVQLLLIYLLHFEHQGSQDSPPIHLSFLKISLKNLETLFRDRQTKLILLSSINTSHRIPIFCSFDLLTSESHNLFS